MNTESTCPQIAGDGWCIATCGSVPINVRSLQLACCYMRFTGSPRSKHGAQQDTWKWLGLAVHPLNPCAAMGNLCDSAFGSSPGLWSFDQARGMAKATSMRAVGSGLCSKGQEVPRAAKTKQVRGEPHKRTCGKSTFSKSVHQSLVNSGQRLYRGDCTMARRTSPARQCW